MYLQTKYQCFELDDFFTPGKKKEQVNLHPKKSDDKEDYYQLRAQLVKAIDPMDSERSELEDKIIYLPHTFRRTTFA